MAVTDTGQIRAGRNYAKRPNRLFKNINAKIAALPMILTASVIFIGCSIWTIVHSFTNSKLLPKLDFVGFDQYERLWGSARWLVSVQNLVIFGVCSLIATFFIAFILAALLDRKIRFEDGFRTIFLYLCAVVHRDGPCLAVDFEPRVRVAIYRARSGVGELQF